MNHLTAAKGEQLVCQLGCSLAGSPDLFHAPPAGISLRQVLEHQFAVTVDDGEHVVEVVRHAAGQTTHALQLLGLCQLLLEGPAFGDLVGHREEARHAVQVDRLRRQKVVVQLSVPVANAHLVIAHPSFPGRRFEESGELVRISPQAKFGA